MAWNEKKIIETYAERQKLKQRKIYHLEDQYKKHTIDSTIKLKIACTKKKNKKKIIINAINR